MREKYIKSEKNKFTLIIITIILLICIIGIIIYVIKKPKDTETAAEEIINNAFTQLKLTNIEEINKYIDYNQLVSGLDEMILEQSKGEVSNLQKELFKNMYWNIKSVNIDGNKIEVTIEMENKDFKEILTKWIKEIVDKKATNEVITNEICLEVLEKIVTQTNNTKKVTKNIQIERENDNWKIIVNDNLRNLIFTGIESVATAVEEQN